MSDKSAQARSAMQLDERTPPTRPRFLVDQANELVERVVAERGRVHLGLLPDPEPEELWCPVISGEDHVYEPDSLFDRVPVRHRDLAPRVVRVHDHPAWQVGDQRYFVHAVEGASGRPLREARVLAVDPAEFRLGVREPRARLADMDVDGVWASVCFPSGTWFSNRVLSSIPDRDAAYACVQAYNDWLVDEWCGADPQRLIASPLSFLADVDLAVAEVRRNAARGVRCVGFSENPQSLGFPSLHSGYWDPFFAACVDTGTVVNLHLASSERELTPSTDGPRSVSTALFPLASAVAAVDWLFAGIPSRFPELRVVFSGGSASWVPFVVGRLDRAYRLRDECLSMPGAQQPWPDDGTTPMEVLRRNFWFTANDDRLAFEQLDRIGDDRVMIDIDYPHPDSLWPHTQSALRDELGHLPVTTVRKVCFENAADLYRLAPPPDHLLARAAALRDSAS